jgi:hypothetical protein
MAKASTSDWNRAFLVLEFSCIPLVIWWIPYTHLPAPGWAVAFIAGAAAAMSVHDEMRGWQKGIWLLIIGAFLITELRAISKDRADNAATQEKFFDNQKNGFSVISGSLQVAVESLRQTLVQTAPRALFGKPYVDFGRAEIGPGTQFHYNVTMTNVGNDTARNVDIFSQMYPGKPDDSSTQLRLATQFEKAWRKHKTLHTSSQPPGSPSLATFYSPRFSLEDVTSIMSASRTLYTFYRTSYSDDTGTWYSDYCDDLQVPIQAAGILGHPCPVTTSSRYKPKQP